MGDDIPAMDLASEELRFFKVPLNGLAGSSVGFDEVDRDSAAAKGLDPKRSRAGEEIEHPCVADQIAEDRKKRLTDPIGGGAGETPRDLERDATRAA